MIFYTLHYIFHDLGTTSNQQIPGNFEKFKRFLRTAWDHVSFCLAHLEIIAWFIFLGLTFSSPLPCVFTVYAVITIIGLHQHRMRGQPYKPSFDNIIWALFTGVLVGWQLGMAHHIGWGIVAGLGVFIIQGFMVSFTLEGMIYLPSHVLISIANILLGIYEGICILISNTSDLLSSADKENDQKGKSTDHDDKNAGLHTTASFDTLVMTAAPPRAPTKDDFLNHFNNRDSAKNGAKKSLKHFGPNKETTISTNPQNHQPSSRPLMGN